MKAPKLLFAAPALFSPLLAHAHPGHDGHDFSWSFSSDFVHSHFGWPHLLAAIALIGLAAWAVKSGMRQR